MTSNDSTKPKRSLHRFSLRTALLLLTVLTVFYATLGWKVDRARKQREAVNWVAQADGHVTYEYEMENGSGSLRAPKWFVNVVGVDLLDNVTGVHLTGAQIRALSQLAVLEDLTVLNLDHTRVSDISPLMPMGKLEALFLTNTDVSDVAALAGLTKLQWLILNNSKVRDVTPLAGLTVLQTLDLSHTKVKDLTPLTAMKKLKRLDLQRTLVSDATPLADLTQLKMLGLSNTPLNDVTALADLSSLTQLDLQNTRVSDVTPLAGLSNLITLSLDNSQVSDVRPLTGLKNLRGLGLSGTKVDDVSPLRCLTGLRRLTLGVEVSETDLEGLKHALPECKIHIVEQLGEASPSSVALFSCQVVDASTGELVKGDGLTVECTFKRQATREVNEEIVSILYGAPDSSPQFQFLVPEKVMLHPHRDTLVVQISIRHPDYEIHSSKLVEVGDLLHDEPKSVRDVFRWIELKHLSSRW